jgi:ABC-2 type transport system ATP-binding protein
MEGMRETVVAETRGVVKQYGAVRALGGVDLAIGRGELVALLGPNGAGKTTLVRLLLGLATASAGEVALFGQSPRRREVRLRCGAMLQGARAPEMLRVREHIELFSSYYPAPLPLAETVAAAALGGLENRLFGQLSGGQRQRVLFALALCGNPELLFLDEPAAGLDIEARRALWEHIRRFVDRGGSVLLTTHQLDEADALADRLVVIHRGRIVAAGTPAEVKSRTALKKIRCATRLDEPSLRAIAGVARVGLGQGAAEIFTAEPERVLRELLARDPYLSGLEIGVGGLEEAVLALTGGSLSERTN